MTLPQATTDEPKSSNHPSIEERLNALETWARRIESRIHRYPAEHSVETDRDRIYSKDECARA